MSLVAVNAVAQVRTRRYRTLSAAACVVLAATCAVVFAATPLGASPALGRAPAISGLVDFGCANPANRVSAKLQSAAQQHARNGVTCFGQARAEAGEAGPHVTAGPVGNGPSQIQSAYKLAGQHANGRTVGIVDAFDDPNAQAD